jgi:hypothetical protein
LREVQNADNLFAAAPVFTRQVPHNIDTSGMPQSCQLAAQDIWLSLKRDIHRDFTIDVWEHWGKGKGQSSLVLY